MIYLDHLEKCTFGINVEIYAHWPVHCCICGREIIKEPYYDHTCQGHYFTVCLDFFNPKAILDAATTEFRKSMDDFKKRVGK